MRQQIDLVQDHDVRRSEHVRIFERLILAFRNRQNDDLRPLAEIEQCWANQIPDISIMTTDPGSGFSALKPSATISESI